MVQKETRSMSEKIELRSHDEEENYIEGYALKFGTESEDLGGFIETIERDALKDTDFSDVRALFNHNADHIIARSSADTLKLEVDDIGLKFKARIPNTTYGRDLLENLRNGNVNQCSFGFRLAEKGDVLKFDETRNIYKRTLKNIKEILDVSVVTYPAYKKTDVAPVLRSIEELKSEELRKHNLEMEKLKLELEFL